MRPEDMKVAVRCEQCRKLFELPLGALQNIIRANREGVIKISRRCQTCRCATTEAMQWGEDDLVAINRNCQAFLNGEIAQQKFIVTGEDEQTAVTPVTVSALPSNPRSYQCMTFDGRLWFKHETDLFDKFGKAQIAVLIQIHKSISRLTDQLSHLYQTAHELDLSAAEEEL